ncbi:5'/3'-nucleotidase SurE [Nonomuraea typhae]|uniref:5'/3'-nucleotidase SurE n=1 Tax=Nonomuraea typhae TaxID=2603600 RepID=UPI0012FB4DF0|nr:5'/3'-nucleotidase SurE [Nonomuraea typhae]
MFRRILLLIPVLLSVLALPAPARAQPPASLRILLTNDDGYQAPFTLHLRQALIAAGHDVTIVAPAGDSSGVGTSINIRFGTTVEAAEMSPGVWAIAGTPADAVSFGVRKVFAADPPDLVVSGPNQGENVAAAVNHSGTVGAAVTALEVGIPALALSTARQGSAFPGAAQAVAFGVKLVNRLAATAPNGLLLPARTALNVNYPAAPTGEVRVSRLGRMLPVTVDYLPATDVCARCYRLQPLFATTPDPVADADRTHLAAGAVTITPLTDNWEARPAIAARLGARLDDLTP